MAKPLRVLIVEDSEDDVLLLLRTLRRGDYDLSFERVDTCADFQAALSSQMWDIVVADYSLPAFDGLTALRVMRDSGCDLPFVLVSGTIGEELAVAAMKAGAHDYVMKDNLARLLPAVERELQEAGIRLARKQAEEALRESEERFRRMADSIRDGLTIVEGGRVVYVNERMSEITGYSRAELLAMNGLDFAAPEEQARLRRIMAGAQQSGTFPSQLEFWIVRKDGTRRCIHNRYTTRDDLEGFADRYVVTTDVTEGKQAEREIAERRLYLERVLAAAPDAIVTLDAQHRVVEWNAGAEKLFGYTRYEAIGQRLVGLIARGETLEETRNLTDTGRGSHDMAPIEVVRYRKDGSAADVIASGSPILVEDELVGAVAIYTDISKRKRAERLLKTLNEVALAVEQALTLEEIFATMGTEFRKIGCHCAILLVDETNDRLWPAYFNHESRAVHTAEKLLGIEAATFRMSIDGIDAFRQVIRQRETVTVDAQDAIEQVLPGPLSGFGSQLTQLLRVGQSIDAPLIVEDRVIGMLSVQSNDLTEEDMPAITAFAHQMAAAWRKAQLLQDLESSLKQLKQTQAQFLQAQKMEAVGRLAGGVAHDFNNALTIVHLSTQLLKRQMQPDDPFWEYVDQIEEAGKRATNLTKQLLSFSRREIVEPQVINLSQAITDLSDMLGRIIGEDIELVTSLAKNLWSVWIDPTQMDQVIVNLVVNARDAMPFGGALSIATTNVVLDERGAAQQIDLEPGEYVLLSVSDTGMGMDQEVKAHLFEPFFTTKEPGKGTGLGLATVYGIVRQNGGAISVDSTVGQGSTFSIHLPRTERSELPGLGRPAVLDAAGGSETILVVEDDPAVRKMARQILKANGYRVLVANSGPMALEVARKHEEEIHLLLTDVVLPQMNGRELAECLRAQRPSIRTIYMSGYSDDAIAHRGVVQDGISFLPKPFTVETLTQKVRLTLDASS